MSELTTNSATLPETNQSLAAVHTKRACLLLVASVIALFGITIQFDFVNWDDPWYVKNNELIQEWSIENLYGICTQTVTRNFAPLTIFSYLIDRTLWGEWAGGYHLTNTLLHALNAVLAFFLVRQVTGRHVFALLVATLFAIHPVQIESVVWISARKGLLASAFMLGSLLFWLRPERTAREELIGTGFFLIALFCKASAVVIPPIVLLYDWQLRSKPFLEALIRQIVGGLIAVWFILLTAGSQNSQTGGIRHHLSLSKLELLGIDTVLLWKYLGMIVWPQSLAILYDPPIAGIGLSILAATLGWVFVGWLVYRQRESCPQLLFAVGTILLLLLPVLNLFPLTTLMNDRYLYLPSLAIFAILIGCLEWLGHKAYEARLLPSIVMQFRTVAVVAGLLFVAVALKTAEHLPVWKTDRALWNQAVQVSPELPLVRYQHSLALWNAGEKQAAISELEIALSLPRVDELDRERFEEKLQKFQSELSDSKQELTVL